VEEEEEEEEKVRKEKGKKEKQTKQNGKERKRRRRGEGVHLDRGVTKKRRKEEWRSMATTNHQDRSMRRNGE